MYHGAIAGQRTSERHLVKSSNRNGPLALCHYHSCSVDISPHKPRLTIADSPHCTTAGTRVVELDLGEEAELECSMGWDQDLELDWTLTSHLDR